MEKIIEASIGIYNDERFDSVVKQCTITPGFQAMVLFQTQSQLVDFHRYLTFNYAGSWTNGACINCERSMHTGFISVKMMFHNNSSIDIISPGSIDYDRKYNSILYPELYNWTSENTEIFFVLKSMLTDYRRELMHYHVYEYCGCELELPMLGSFDPWFVDTINDKTLETAKLDDFLSTFKIL